MAMISNFISKMGKTVYADKGKLNKINHEIFDVFNSNIDFTTLKFKENSCHFTIDFKVIVLITGTEIEAICKYSNIRHVIKSFSVLPEFENVLNLHEYDVVNFMKQK